VFPVRYKLNSYLNLLRNSVFKGLTHVPTATDTLVEIRDVDARQRLAKKKHVYATTGHSLLGEVLGLVMYFWFASKLS
jgi:hypothetical protein